MFVTTRNLWMIQIDISKMASRFITRVLKQPNETLLKTLRPALCYSKTIESFEHSIKLRIVPTVADPSKEVVSINDAVKLVKIHGSNENVVSILKTLSKLEKPLTDFDYIQLCSGDLELLQLDCTKLHPKSNRSVSIDINKAKQIIDAESVMKSMDKIVIQSKITVIIFGLTAILSGMTVALNLMSRQ